MELSHEEHELLALVVNTDNRALFEAIGDIHSQSELGISPPTREELYRIGKNKLTEIRKKFKDTLCSEEFIERINTIDSTDRKKAILAIADIIIGYGEIPPALYASTIIVRESLQVWCIKGN